MRLHVWSAAAGLAAVLALAGCRPGADDSGAAPVEEKVVTVEARVLQPSRIEDWAELPGRVEPFRSVTVGAEVGGALERLAVDEGDRVSRGQELAVIDREGLALQLRQAELARDQAGIRIAQAELALERAELEARRARAGQAEAQARLAQAEAQARKAEAVRDRTANDRDRVQALFADELASRSRLDDAEAALAVAVADADAAREGIAAARSGIEAASVSLETAETAVRAAKEALAAARSLAESAAAGLDQAQLVFDKGRIVSPIDGVVDHVFSEEGELVKGQDPLLRLVQLDPVKAVMPVPEKDMPFVRQGMAASVTVESLSEEPGQGTVSFLAVTSDPATSTFRMEVDLPNADARLRPGMLARLSLLRRAVDAAVVVPYFTVLRSEEGYHVFVYEEGIARRRAVTTGVVEGDRVQVTAGLALGESLIVKGQRDLDDGQRVALP